MPKVSILKKKKIVPNESDSSGWRKDFSNVFFFHSFFGPINEQMHSCVVFSSNQGEPYTRYHRICTVVVPAQQTFLRPEVELWKPRVTTKSNEIRSCVMGLILILSC